MLVGNAHIGQGSAEDVALIAGLLKKEGEAAPGSLDFFLRSFNHFGVDDARDIRERASLKPVSARRRVFAITASTMTSEAQNALLKVFEEPPADALFILLVPSPETLLPTLRSRTQKLLLDFRARAGIIHAKEFLAAKGKTRLDLLKSLLEKDDDDKRDIGAVISFLADIERALEKTVSTPETRQGLEAIYRARKYVNDKGALLKPLLEQAALLIP